MSYNPYFFLCPMKTSENLLFSDAFQGVWKGTSAIKRVEDIFNKYVGRMLIFMLVP